MAGENKMKIPSNTTALFQGDSITDAGRDRKNSEDLGAGYAMIAAAWFSAIYPEKNVRFLNRGVSGNRIRELKDRWKKDCLDLGPSVVSILVGANDTLDRYLWNSPTSTERFEKDYTSILEQTWNVLNAQIVLLEPFLLHVTKDQLRLRENINQKIESVRKLSRKFKTLLVPLDKIFAEATEKREPSFWSLDGIHPTLAGHALIAQSWLKCVTNNQV